jgi:predicted nucleic acid-binding protein
VPLQAKTAFDATDYHVFSSVITLTEVLTQPLKKSRNDIVEKYRNFLLNSKNFHLYPIDAIIAEKAAELRSRHSILRHQMLSSSQLGLKIMPLFS